MAKASFTLSGDKELERQLRRLNAAMGGAALVTILEQAGEIILDAAEPNVPYRTGALRESGHVGKQESGGHSAEVSVIYDKPYSARIEYGFFGTDSLGRTYHQPAQPYLRPAIASTRRIVKHTITVAVKARLKRAVG